MGRFILAIIVVGCLTTVAFADSREPSAQVEALAKVLQSGKIEGVLIDFFANSLLAEQRPTELHAMDAQVKAALDFYGRSVNYEIVETTKMGNSLVRIKWITKHKRETPMFWNVLFYRRNGKWEPLNILVFDDPTKAGF
jgi:hypothetical protein